MQRVTHGQHRPAPFDWLIGCVMWLSLCVAWAQEDAAQWASQASVEKTQKNLQQLSHQVGLWRSTAVHEGLQQMKKNESMHQKVGSLEHGQDALGMQLAEIHQQISKHFLDLKNLNRQMMAALWSLAILTSLLVLLCIRLYRRALPTNMAPPSPSPSPLPKSDVISKRSELWPRTASEKLSAQSAAQQTAVFLSDPDLAVSATADWTTPWFDSANAALNNTQNTLTQVRQDFMRAAHIET